MSNKNLHFVRRYTKRETVKRDFRIVKTWSTPKESDSEPHSGPSGSVRKGHVPSLDSSDSSDVTYNPPESSELPSGSGQSTAPATTSETSGALETETLDTETQETEKETGKETQAIEETPTENETLDTEPPVIEETPTETENVTETPYNSETPEYLPRSTTQSSGNSRECSSSPASTSTSVTSGSTSKETSSKDSSEVSLSEDKSSRKASVKKKTSQEKTSKESSSPKDETNKNKWTVKNWKDVDILTDHQALSPSLVTLEVPRPPGDEEVRQESVEEVQETSDHEGFPAPPDLVHEPHQGSGDQRVDENEEVPVRSVYHEESPAPPELVHEPSADQPLLEDSSLSSPSPVGADEPPELERNDTSDTNNASNLSTLSRTLSICLERIQVKQYQVKNYSDRIETSQSPERETEDRRHSEPEDKITSSQDSRRKEYKMKGLGPKSVQMKRRAAKKTSVSDCDSSAVGQIASSTEESTKDTRQLVSSSGKEPSVSPPGKEEESVDPQRREGEADDEPLVTPKGRKSTTLLSPGPKSKRRSTGKQKSPIKGKVKPTQKKSEIVKQTGSKKLKEKSRSQSSPESGPASETEDTTKSKKKTSTVKASPRKVKSATKAKVSKQGQEFNSEEDKHSEKGETDNELVKQAGSRKYTKTSRQTSPESSPASDVEKTSRTRKKRSLTPTVKESPKKSKGSKVKAAKSQYGNQEGLSELEQPSEKEDSASQPVKQTASLKGAVLQRRQVSPESGPESDEGETRSRKKKSVPSASKETPKKAKVAKRTKVTKYQNVDEESLSDEELLQKDVMPREPAKETGSKRGAEPAPQSDGEEKTKMRKKKSDIPSTSMSKKNKTSKTKTSKSNDADESPLSEQADYSKKEDSTRLQGGTAGKKKPEIMKRPSKTPSRSRTPSSSTHEEDSTQAKRTRLSPRGRRSTEQEAVEDDDAHSVASSLRLEGVDFEKTPQVESDVTTKPGASPSSLWKGKKISALKARAWSPRRREQTSSVASDDMSMVSSLPTEKTVARRYKPVKRSAAKQPKEMTAKKAKAKPRRARQLGSGEEQTYAGRSVTVWSQSNQPRRGADVLDLDIVLECLQSVEREMYEEAESRPCEKATQKVGSFVRKEIHKTISQVQEIKHNQTESKKLQSSVRNLRAELQEKQISKIKLNTQLKKLKTQSGIDEDLINLNSWLDDYDKLMNSWDQSKSSNSKQQKYRWIGDITDDMKELF